MSEGPSVDAEISRMRVKLDALAVKQSEEIGHLRMALADLQRRQMGSASPPPLPDNLLDEPKKVEENNPVFRESSSEVPEVKDPEPAMEWAVKRLAAEKAPAIAEVRVPAEPRGSFELQLGRVWLVRLGVALLVTGLVLLGNYAYRNWIRDLPAILRLAFLFLGSFGLIGVGWRFTLKESMRRFGEVLLAGGLAFFYWCTFAAHQVDRLKVVESPVLASLMMLAAAGLIVGVSLKRDAKVTAVMGLLLASYSTVLQPLGWLSAASNVVLATAGMMLMRRRDWSGPGIASMVGTYGAFLWWQIAGASGAAPDRMGLFFLPASWAVFALPGIAGLAGSFSQSLSERGRAWFAGANNGVFFTLFSLLWLMLDYDAYWRVPAVFGLVILVIGAMGRSRESSGSTHVGQGLGFLTLALVLKLDGYQLALGLALEGLMLAVAFLRFRRPLELVFSMLAQAGAMAVVLYSWQSANWASGVAALLVAAAAVVLRMGNLRVDDSAEWKEKSRKVTLLGLGMSTVMAVVWCVSLEMPWSGLVPMGLALVLAAGCFKWDRRGWLPEAKWMSLAFGIVGGGLFVFPPHGYQPWVWLSCLLLAGASAVLWERECSRENGDDKVVNGVAPLAAWVFGLIVLHALARSVMGMGWLPEVAFLASAVLIPGLAFIAMRVLHCPRLRTSIAFLLGMTLYLGIEMGSRFSPLHFLMPISALATYFGSRTGLVQSRRADRVFNLGTRSVALIGWCAAWFIILPDHWLEILALSGGALLFWKNRVEGLRIPEAWVLLIGTATVLLKTFIVASWTYDPSEGLPMGWGVLIAFFVASLSRPKGDKIGKLLHLGTAVVTVLWSTLALVQSMGWSAVAILWTLLGFGFVCAGLWMRITVWRHAGFALLGFALIKLFASDVWDFGAFTRVVAFIALGAALVVLGFFYNRFAELLKRILEEDEE